MAIRRGDTVVFDAAPVIGAWAAVGGKKDSKGPLAAGFDRLVTDNSLGQDCWEKAESQLAVSAAGLCLQKAGLHEADVQLALAGDLQAQCTASGYAMRGMDVPYAGLYGACSTMAEGLALAAGLCSGGLADPVLALASSHFCAAERQFRTPLNYGSKRTPTAQWTATAAGAVLVRRAGPGPRIRAAAMGRVRDYGVKDINNMGAAMAPAAAETICRFFADRGLAPGDYDMVFTGDLGRVGSGLLTEILRQEGLSLPRHADCGCVLYAPDQKVKAGGSGAGCCASVLAAYILPRLASGQWRRVLFCATGALMSQTTILQKESIPAIAHAVELEAPETPDAPA